MTRLSVNINKVALIRNARGSNFPNILKVAQDCEEYGAQGITVHPRPDQRHIRYDDLQPLKNLVKTEFNIEGNPRPELTKHILSVQPHQVTLVPDDPNALTSDHGWDAASNMSFLKREIKKFKEVNIRTSLFIDPEPDRIKAAAETGTDRIELYTGPYAEAFERGDFKGVLDTYAQAAEVAHACGLQVNAGHDLNLHNLRPFKAALAPYLAEVSIGHALIVDALYLGLENVIKMYLHALRSED
ncbi:MAG: pyridoxine 5'-phosphate synthase [Bacteroidetes bacterium]|jgi:pyridoxine 5-phosphate synthase|nr:pyridoxine 5'-phosphate synthase [Bacteroidota bacterium]